jgi:hypothetical protein
VLFRSGSAQIRYRKRKKMGLSVEFNLVLRSCQRKMTGVYGLLNLTG